MLHSLKILLLIFLFQLFNDVFSQSEKKQLTALRINEVIKIDGLLTEPAWNKAKIATNFVTYQPTNGLPASKNTEVKILYDNNFIYIGAFMLDNAPDSILKELSRRDNMNVNADMFWVDIATYNDGQNVVSFKISASNVQSDIKYSILNPMVESSMLWGNGDNSWDAVWESNTSINDSGWVAEIKIPYSAFRFSSNTEQVWGINFWRQIRRTREICSWSRVDKKIDGVALQSGELVGINNIKTPVRLALYPYLANYFNNNSETNLWSYSFNGGMDIKYGITESYTLDMTLIPDFRQVRSDEKILNLTPFEVVYSEKRQFFTEGTELFNKGNLFYSRRIGDVPEKYFDIASMDSVKIINNPMQTKLINATKISGRNRYNTGLGLFNAITANTYATIEDHKGEKYKLLTEPFTNYNILVFDKVFQKNSYFNLINTNVYTPSSKRLANVSATSFRLTNKKNVYSIEGTFAASLITDTINPDVTVGEYMSIKAGKTSGVFVYTLQNTTITNQYNPNDLGYLKMNNTISNCLTIRYSKFEPYWKLLNASITGNTYYNMLYLPNKFTELYQYFLLRGTLYNYLSLNISGELHPFNTYDYYEARTINLYYIRKPFYTQGFRFSSDYRKTLALDGETNFIFSLDKKNSYNYAFSPRIRLNDHVLLVHEIKYIKTDRDYGYVTKLNNDTVIFGKRNIRQVINTFSTNYVFNNKSSLSLTIRHYWSRVHNYEYFLLQTNGLLVNYNYNKNSDINYNILTIDLMYSWNFAPGSYLTTVWKNNIEKLSNIIITNFSDNLLNTWQSPQINSFSVKILYYFDYQYLRKQY